MTSAQPAATSAPAPSLTPARTVTPPAIITAPAQTEPTTPPAPVASATPAAPALPPCQIAPTPMVVTLCIHGAVLRVDARLSDADLGAILRQVTDDLAAVQAEFDWNLRSTAFIDVYDTNEHYSSGLREVFGYSQATADYLAENSVAFFEPSLRRIAVSWQAISDRRPIAAIRHELTHLVTLEACAPRCDLVPAWFNEGEARLMEALIPGAVWRMMRVRYEAASMVATDTLLPLSALWTQYQWNAYGDWAGYYKYQEAARATDLIRADVGEHAIARLYARMRAGDDFATAYARLTGRAWSSFLASLPARLSADIAPGPAISLVQPGADGTGASFLLYGFPSEAKVTLSIKARYAHETSEIGVSPQGAYFGSIDASYPPGTYTITAASGSSVAAVTVIKRGGRAVRAALFD